MDAFKRSLDNYITRDTRESFGECEDGHAFIVKYDEKGRYRVCEVCEEEQDLPNDKL
jgi:hypothetical protein